MLLGRPDRQHHPVVVVEIGVHLLPVDVEQAHPGHLSDEVGRLERSAGLHPLADGLSVSRRRTAPWTTIDQFGSTEFEYLGRHPLRGDRVPRLDGTLHAPVAPQ